MKSVQIPRQPSLVILNSYVVVFFFSLLHSDMVSRPNLVVTRVSSSSAHCDLNVTCSTADSELITNSVSCNSSDCSLQETETSRDTVSGAVLSLFLSHDNLVVCQLSNNVSQRRITEEILQLCVTDSGRKRYYDVCHLSKCSDILLTPEVSVEMFFSTKISLSHLISGSRFFIIIGSVVGVTVVICLVVIFILFYRKHRPGKSQDNCIVRYTRDINM